MKQVAQVFVCDVLAKGLMVLSGLAVIRFMPEGEFASLALVFAVNGMITAGVVGNLNKVFVVGHQHLGLRDDPQSFLSMQLWILAALAAAGLPLCWLLGPLYGLMVLLTLSSCLSAFAQTVFQHEIRFLAYSLIELTRAVLFCALLAAVAWRTAGGLAAWHVVLLQAACSLVAVAAFFGKRLAWRRLFDVRNLWIVGRPVVLSRYACMLGYFWVLSVFLRVDILVLSGLDSKLMVATYGAAFRFFSILTMLLTALHTVFLPMTQKTSEPGELRRLFANHARMLWYIVPLVVVGAWLSGWLIPLVDGGKYPQAVLLCRVLSCSAVASLAFSPYVNILFRFDQFRFLLLLAIVSLCLNLALTLAVVPRYHALGAAVATVVSSGFLNFVTFVRARRLLDSGSLPALAARPAQAV